MSKYFGPLFAALLVVAFAGDALAQRGMYYGWSFRQSPEENVFLSQHYDWLLRVHPGFRHYRMWKECHTINFSQALRSDCLASFDQYEPMMPGPWY